MKINRMLFRLLLPVVLIIASLFAEPSTAKADVINDVAWVLDQTSPNPFGINGSTLLNARSFFTCIDDGGDPIICYDSYFRPILENQGIIGIPTWFTNFVDGYVAIVTEDYWGLIVSWGETAFCAACNGLTGVDVCYYMGLYIQLYEEAYDLAKSVLDFFGIDLGAITSWVWNTLEDAWCSVFGCDEDAPPPPPAEAVAFVNYFYPNISNGRGLFTIKSSDQLFKLDYDSIKKKALAAGIPAAAVDIAGANYTTAVNDQWTGNMVSNVLGDLATKRNQYNKPDRINALAQLSWDRYLQGKGGCCLSIDGINVDWDICHDEFRSYTMGYEHVDRWISKFPAKAQSVNAKTNAFWCRDVYAIGNEASFKAFFREKREDRVRASCPPTGQKFICPTTTTYSQCLSDLSYAGKQNRCVLSSAAANSAVEKIDQYFKSNGSTIPCTIVLSNSSGTAAKYICKRPVQRNKCDEYYNSAYSGFPIKLVNCVLNEDPAYTALKAKVGQVVSTLNSANGAEWVKHLPGKDPLLVQHTTKWGVVIIKKKNMDNNQQSEVDFHQSFGFQPPSTQSGFIIVDAPYDNLPFDGLSTPTLVIVKGLPPGAISAIKPEITGKTPAQKLKEQLESGEFKPNPVDEGVSVIGSSGLTGKGVGVKESGLGNIGGPKVVGGPGNITIPGKSGGGELSGGGALGNVNVSDKLSEQGINKVVGSGGSTTGPAYNAGTNRGVNDMVGAKRADTVVKANLSNSNRGDTAANVQLQNQALSGSVLAGSQGPSGGAPVMTPMSGSLPPGFTPPVTPPVTASKPSPPAPAPAPAPLPDITALAQLKVAGLSAAWNGVVTVDANQAVSKNKNNSGFCEYAVEYGLSNSGGPMTGSFRSLWTNDAVTGNWSRQWSSLAAGAQKTEKEIIAMKPGSNKLQLVVDDQQQIKESNEKNNTWRVTVNVTGNCAETIRQPQQNLAPPKR